jgi:hypothetical protein
MAETGALYYGIVAALPELPRKGVEGFRPLQIPLQYQDLLEPEDSLLLCHAYLPIDHANLLHYLAGRKQFLAGGNYLEDDIRRIATGEWTPWPYLGLFLQDYRERGASVSSKEADRLLTRYWYLHLLAMENTMLREWALLQWRLLRHAYQQAPESLRPELQAERELMTEVDPGEDATQTALPESLQIILRQSDLTLREQEVDEWIWEYLEEQIRFTPFSVDALLSYALRQQICARRSAFQSYKPENVLDRLVESALTEVL